MKESRQKQPYIKKPEKIELEEKPHKLRVFVACLFLVFGIGFITYGIVSIIQGDSGWRKIEADTALEGTLSGEFYFNYNVGASGISARIEYRNLTEAYNSAVGSAAKAFLNQEYAGVGNLYTINHSPNTAVSIDENLYRALELCNKYSFREIYLGPLYSDHLSMCLSADDNEAYNYDPYVNPDEREFFTTVSEFANDDSHISLELCGDNIVILHVSDEYLAYAEEYGIEDFIDFYWFRNAFAIDYIADELIKSGFTKGSIGSYDGYIRNLDSTTHETYSYTIYDKVGTNIYTAAEMTYTGQMTLLFLRSYPLNYLDLQRYRETESGEIRSPFINPETGLSETRVNNLVFFSHEIGCAETLLKTIDFFIGSPDLKLTVDELDSKDDRIDYVFCENNKIFSSSDEVNISSLYSDENTTYSLGD